MLFNNATSFIETSDSQTLKFNYNIGIFDSNQNKEHMSYLKIFSMIIKIQLMVYFWKETEGFYLIHVI